MKKGALGEHLLKSFKPNKMTESFTNLGLFPDENKKIMERKAIAEEHYMNYGFDFEPVIHECHNELMAQADARNTPVKWRNYYPSSMSWLVHDKLVEHLANDLEYDDTSRPYIRLSENVRVYFKMLDNNFRPKNVTTKHVRRLNQSHSDLFGEEQTNLYIGWRIRKDKYWDGLSGVYMVEMMSHKHCMWVTDLSDMSSMLGATATTIQPITPISPINNDDVIIIPNRARDKDNAS